MSGIRVVNTLEVKTDIGRCFIDLCVGDITALEKRDEVDVLVVSAFPGKNSREREEFLVTRASQIALITAYVVFVDFLNCMNNLPLPTTVFTFYRRCTQCRIFPFLPL